MLPGLCPRRPSILQIVGAVVFATVAATIPVRAAPPTLATVNGVPISRRAVLEVVKGVLASTAELPTDQEIARLTDDALTSLIDLELLHQEARQKKIEITSDEVDAAIDDTRSKFPDEDAFADALHRSGMSEASLRAETKKTLLVNHLLQRRVWSRVHISPAQIRRFYDENRSALTTPQRLRLRHLLVRVPTAAAPTERAAALDRIRELRRRILAGADFAAVARRQSDDADSAQRGGDLGYLDPDTTGPVVTAARRLNPGEMSEVVQSSDGYHLVQVSRRQAGKPVAFEQVKEKIRLLLEKRDRQRRRDVFVAQLRQKAHIKRPTTTEDPAVSRAGTSPAGESHGTQMRRSPLNHPGEGGDQQVEKRGQIHEK